MDRNSIIGFVLLLILGTGYIFWNNHEQKVYEQQKVADSVAAVHQHLKDSSRVNAVPLTGDSSKAVASHNKITNTTPADSLLHGKITYTSISNNVLSLRFSSKGGYPVQATLKKYNRYQGGVVNYFNGKKNQLTFEIPYNNGNISTGALYFTPSVTTTDSTQKLTMTATLEGGKKVILYYILPNKGYMLQAGFQLLGFGATLSNMKSIPMTWTTQVLKTEKDMENERYYMKNHVWYKDGDDDYFRLTNPTDKTLDKKAIAWFSVRSHFFNSTIIANNELTQGEFHTTDNKSDDSSVITVSTNNFQIPIVNGGNQFTFGFRWLISPNDYHLLKSYHIGLENIISLGYGVFFFVKYISKWIIIPLFDFIITYIGNIGISIILLIFVIRFVLSFFTYKSYLSSAKMRALKPELDTLKEKNKGNQQQMGMDQMKLYRTAGVNPLGGCLPMLLQMPFLLAVYYFIPTAIQLRQVPFLWCADLSTYDSICHLPFNIPFYGDHVSLFTLLMTATSLILALYNQKYGMPGAGGAPTGSGGEMAKMMKYMPYVMPIMFLGWFNRYAAGLTLYYTCSNLISLGIQFVIQKFVIDEDSIHAKIQERRRQPATATTSKWQQRLEEMQKTQQDKLKNKKKF